MLEIGPNLAKLIDGVMFLAAFVLCVYFAYKFFNGK